MIRTMDYADAKAAYFQLRPESAPPPGTASWDALPGRRLRHALEPLATISFWGEPAVEVNRRLGLDFLEGYALSRGSVLGDAEPAVVASAFGTFQPAAVVALWTSARARCGIPAVRAARQEGALASLVAVVGPPPEGLDRVVAALRRAAMAVRTTSRPVTAGLVALPWPDDPLVALWHGATLLREYRGECHLSACAVAGLDGLEANLLTERQVGYDPMTYTASRGWSVPEMESATRLLEDRGLLDGTALSERGRALRDRVEAQTEAQEEGVLAAIGDDLDEVVERCGAWAGHVVARGWFPPDPYKRAAG